MKKPYAVSIAIIFVLLGCLAVYRYVYLSNNSCIQVLVSATHRITGKEAIFGNPCSIPVWYKDVRDYNPDDTLPRLSSIDIGTQLYDSATQKILTSYLSPYNNDFTAKYSGLTADEIILIDKIISLAQKQATYTQEEVRAARDIYQRLFVTSIDERVQDAPSGRANELIRTKLCIARAIISSRESEAVKDCVADDKSPSDIQWSTDDITAVAQIVPYYLAGSHYFSLDDARDLSRYYLRQVVLHQEKAIEQWDQVYFEEIAGEEYLDMVEDTRGKLQLLNKQ